MAETSGPFDGTELAEADWEQMLQHVIHGVIGSPGSSALSAGPSATLARGVDINIGNALMLGHWYRNSAIKTLQSAVNGTSSPRIDRAVLRLDRTTNVVTLEKIQGTAGGQAPTPANTATITEVPVHRWTIGAGGTVATALTDERPFLGSVVAPCTSTNRPLNPWQGMVGYETDTGRWIGWNGSGWRVISEDSGDITLTATSGWTADASGGLTGRRVNGLVDIELNLKRSGGTVPEGTDSRLTTIPAALRPGSRIKFVNAHITSDNFCRVDVQPDGEVWMRHMLTSFATGEFLRATITYIP